MIFTILLFPLLFFILTEGLNPPVFESKKTVYFHAFCGFLIAVVYCAIDWFFVSPVRFAGYVFAEEFVWKLFSNILLPVFVCGILYFLFVKEPYDYKLKNFAFLMFGFFAVFLPYYIFTRSNPVPAFLMFAKPFIFLGLVVALYFVLKSIA